MTRRILFVGLLGTSIFLLLLGIASYWHLMYIHEIRRGGVRILHVCGGSLSWRSWDDRGKMTTPSNWSSIQWEVPLLVSLRTTRYGYVHIRSPGLSVGWYRQQTGFRYSDVDANFFKLALLAATYPAICVCVAGLVRRKRRRRGCCIKCGYDLTGNTSGVCPECGVEITKP